MIERQIHRPDSTQPITLLCLASYEKGHRFLQQAKLEGCRVFLLTSESLRNTASFPRESLDDIFYLPDAQYEWNMTQMLEFVANLARHIRFDRVVALDDFDLEKAALIREHFRLSGLGESATRLFRDKLAMRISAEAAGIPVPEFTGTANYIDLTTFVDTVPAPWVLKPRMMAGAIGIKKFGDREEFWQRIHQLGNQQSFFVLERFVPGDVFHVDSLWFEGQMLAAVASAYGTPPLTVTQDGGIFTTQLLPSESSLSKDLCSLNEQVLRSFGLRHGVSHTEFIRARETGRLFFLETSARVGGAFIADLIEAGTGLNLWAEWAKIEVAVVRGEPYHLSVPQRQSAGLLVSLARQEWPDTSGFQEPELFMRIQKKNHIAFVLRSPDPDRVTELLNLYTDRVRRDFQASVPPREKPNA